jgi:hypothetical protein
MIQRKKAELIKMLQTAVELELSTIPPYLTAMYSIRPDSNQEAYAVIRSVLMEEMLHMVLTANVLSSLGGQVQLDSKTVKPYPLPFRFAPSGGLPRTVIANLSRLSDETLDVFLDIERPSFLKASPTLKFRSIEIGENTVGEFYEQIKTKLKMLVDEFDERQVFTGNPANQVSEQYYWGAGGKPVQVKDLESAERAIDLVVEQGEGIIMDTAGIGALFNNRAELPHYFRFLELRKGRQYLPGDLIETPTGRFLKVEYEKVYPIKTNCKRKDFEKQPELIHLDSLFSSNYTTMLSQIAEGFNGNPEAFYTAIVNCMRNLSSIARTMVQIPLLSDPQQHAAPTFTVNKGRF